MVPPLQSTRSGSERGFVLLVFALFIALLVIGVYAILPKYVFEGQRQKEDELIFRGQQYTRAIQLFVRKVGRYPNSIDELENTNQIRYLRKPYKDPMTADGDWRLIHIGPGGVFIDSKYPPVVTTASSSGNSGNQPAGNPAPLNSFDLNNPANQTTNNPQQQQQQQRQQTFGGGGIAGVASQSESEAIKVINGYHHYNEWEFIFDFTKDDLARKKIQAASGGGTPQPNQPGPGNTPDTQRVLRPPPIPPPPTPPKLF